MRFRTLLLTPILAVAAAGCAASDETDEETSSDDAALSAYEQEVGFDGAITRLDETALASVDEEAKSLEARRADLATVERATTRSVLLKARSLPAASAATTRAATIHPSSVYDLDLLQLNGLERTLCKNARLVCVRVLLAGLRARGASQAEYRDGNVGGRIDAFRHTYWNALMASSVGVTHAQSWADAHENGYPDNRASEENRRLSDMDFFNNAEGRRIGAAGGNEKTRVREALTNGVLRAVRYDRGDEAGVLVPTSQCTDAVLCGR